MCTSHARLAQTSRIQYRKDAQMAYQQKMLAAHTGKTDFPRIRTFKKTEYSTNSVFQDLEAAENLYVSVVPSNYHLFLIILPLT